MRKHQIENISWQEVLWQRPYDLEAVQNILAQLANLTPRGAVIWEIRGRNGQVSHLLGADKRYYRQRSRRSSGRMGTSSSTRSRGLPACRWVWPSSCRSPIPSFPSKPILPRLSSGRGWRR